NKRPFEFKHDLAGHPQLKLEALFDLATRLPPAEVLHWSGGIRIDDNIDTASRTHATGRSLRETFDHIEDAHSYVLIRNAQLDPTFGRLVNEILDDVEVQTKALEPDMCQRVAYVFIASPRSVTPYHMDRDINFHFNVLGRKTISIWDPFDRVVLPEAGLETLFTDWKAPRPPYSADFEPRAWTFKLGPGDGVHHPFTAPHAVRYGDEVSASFTVTFNTRATNRRAAAHFVNQALRRFGIAPTPVGKSTVQDELKFAAMNLYRRAKGVAGSSSPDE
ncbi:MAG: hypothetical protein FWD17_11165, partial [Polyangiaceae bacterium]|nr:hypothetical protein [Polyangiaceae bacterium]